MNTHITELGRRVHKGTVETACLGGDPMSAQVTAPSGQPRRLLRSTGAVLFGFFTAALLTVATDQLMFALKVFHTSGRPIADASFLVATAYRLIYNVAGCYITARLAPRRPMLHAMVIGWVGMVLTAVNTVATWNTAYGPHWYPLANVLLALPSAWLGGFLHGMRHMETWNTRRATS